VPGVELPPEVFDLTSPLVIGLTNDAANLLHVRRNRLRMMNEQDETTYVDPVAIAEEVKRAKRLFTKQNWPIIDISRRSIEETAAAIIQLRVQQQEQKDGVSQ